MPNNGFNETWNFHLPSNEMSYLTAELTKTPIGNSSDLNHDLFYFTHIQMCVPQYKDNV